MTGEQLVRLAAKLQKGQTILVTGAVGSVGRAAVHMAKKLGAQVIAGVRTSQLADARSLGVSAVLAIDDDDAIAKLGPVDAVADTVGGEVAAKLIARVKQGGYFGYASILPEGTAAINPTVKITRVYAQPDPSKLREFADDVRDGKFILPIGPPSSFARCSRGAGAGAKRWRWENHPVGARSSKLRYPQMCIARQGK